MKGLKITTTSKVPVLVVKLVVGRDRVRNPIRDPMFYFMCVGTEVLRGVTTSSTCTYDYFHYGTSLRDPSC